MKEEYYIQNGYVGNAVLWWRADSKGYTANFKEAGRYSKEQAMAIINNRPNEDRAWLCSHVDETLKAQVITIDTQYLDTQYLDTEFRVTGEKK